MFFTYIQVLNASRGRVNLGLANDGFWYEAYQIWRMENLRRLPYDEQPFRHEFFGVACWEIYATIEKKLLELAEE